MSRVANTRPPAQKVPRLPPDPVRLANVRALPCVICYHWGHTQRSPTEAHHCKSGRYSTRKVADRYTIPLCHSHHNKLWSIPGDEEKIGFHNAQKVWEAEYGPDHDWIAWTDDMIAGRNDD